MAEEHIHEGTVPFAVPGIDIPCPTYYKTIGDLSCDTPPVVMLHGGPGGGHEYLLTFAALWTRYGIPVVFYDQLGCAASTHLRDRAGDGSFWTEALFVSELDNLLDHLNLRDGPGFHLFGHSWGGMLAAAFASSKPRGLRRVVLASALASQETCVQGVKLLRAQLDPEDQEILNKAEKDGDWENADVKRVTALMGARHVCRASPVPPELLPAFKHLAEDTTVYKTMWGQNWLIPYGSLLPWTCIPRLPQISAPTLVYNGEYDTSHDVSTVPFFELIPKVRWITFANAGHMCHVEDYGDIRERVLSTVGDFLVQEK